MSCKLNQTAILSNWPMIFFLTTAGEVFPRVITSTQMERLAYQARQFDKADNRKHTSERSLSQVGNAYIFISKLPYYISNIFILKFSGCLATNGSDVQIHMCASSPGMTLPPDSVCFSSKATHRQTYIKQVFLNE